MHSDSSIWERRLASLLVVIIIAFFLYYLLFPPQQQAEPALAVIRFLASTLAGWAGYLFTGSLQLEGKLPGNGLQIKAGGAFAAFLAVFLLFYTGIPSSSSGVRGLFNKTIITSKIMNPVGNTSEGYPIIATVKGNGAKLSVDLDNIPSNIDSRKYKLITFARISDNPDWDSQGVKPLSKSPSPFELTLWHDPEKNEIGDKRYYEAITIISSTFDNSAPKAYTEDDVDRFSEKKGETLTFYRDDSKTSVSP